MQIARADALGYIDYITSLADNIYLVLIALTLIGLIKEFSNCLGMASQTPYKANVYLNENLLFITYSKPFKFYFSFLSALFFFAFLLFFYHPSSIDLFVHICS